MTRQTDNRQTTDRQIQVMIYDAARVRRLCTKFQVNTPKNNIFHFGGLLCGELYCGQYQILTDPRKGTRVCNLVIDRSHRLGGV